MPWGGAAGSSSLLNASYTVAGTSPVDVLLYSYWPSGNFWERQLHKLFLKDRKAKFAVPDCINTDHELQSPIAITASLPNSPLTMALNHGQERDYEAGRGGALNNTKLSGFLQHKKLSSQTKNLIPFSRNLVFKHDQLSAFECIKHHQRPQANSFHETLS